MIHNFCRSCPKKEYCGFPCENFLNEEFEALWAGEELDPPRRRIFLTIKNKVSQIFETYEQPLTEEQKKEKTRIVYLIFHDNVESCSPYKHTFPALHFKPKK